MKFKLALLLTLVALLCFVGLSRAGGGLFNRNVFKQRSVSRGVSRSATVNVQSSFNVSRGIDYRSAGVVQTFRAPQRFVEINRDRVEKRIDYVPVERDVIIRDRQLVPLNDPVDYCDPPVQQSFQFQRFRSFQSYR